MNDVDGYTGQPLSLLPWSQHTGRTSEAATVTEAEAMKGVNMGPTAQTPTHQGRARSCLPPQCPTSPSAAAARAGPLDGTDSPRGQSATATRPS